MFRYAEAQLALGLCTVVDCPFARPALYHTAAALAQKVGWQPSPLCVLQLALFWLLVS